MRGLTLNLLLALVWALFAGEVSTRELVLGFLLGFGLLALFARPLRAQGYVSRTLAALGFAGFFLRELVVANVHVALFALRPRPPLNPMIVAVPLRLQGDTALTLLAASIGLMPGSVALGFSPDRQVMYLHIIGNATPRQAHESILRVEDRLLRFLTPSPAGPPQEANV